MADDEVLNPFANVTVGIRGLAVYCYNPDFDGGGARRGRWEIAIPRFTGSDAEHELLMNIPGLGIVRVDREVKKIEIRDRVGVPTTPTYQGARFNRKDKATSDLKDYRWLAEFTNNAEIPHGSVIMKRRSEFPDRVRVTMLYIQDAILYTKKVEDFPLLLATHAQTCPVQNGVPRPLPKPQAGMALDSIHDIYGFSSTKVGIDIQSPNGGVVDLILDNGIMTSFPQVNGRIHTIEISNLEPDTASDPEARVSTNQAVYGRGDFFRYYELFVVANRDHFHLWEKFPLDIAGPEPSIEGDCNGVRGSFANLDDLKEPDS